MKKHFLLLITFFALLSGCVQNKYLHTTISPATLPSLVKCSQGIENDTININATTICTKIGDHRIKVGSLINGKETGKWYWYYVYQNEKNKDTLDCYLIKNFKKNDTLILHAVSTNRLDW